MCISDFVDLKNCCLKEEESILESNVPLKDEHDDQEESKESQNMHIEKGSEVFQDIDFHKLKPVER